MTHPQTDSPAALVRRVEELYLANRDVIGADPDHIVPGTELITSGGTT